MRHTLEGGQRLAKSLTLSDVLPSFFERHACHRQALKADERAREIKAMHDLHKALVLIPKTVTDGNAHVLEKNGAAANGALPMAIETVGSDAGGVHRHQQRSHAVGS